MPDLTNASTQTPAAAPAPAAPAAPAAPEVPAALTRDFTQADFTAKLAAFRSATAAPAADQAAESASASETPASSEPAVTPAAPTSAAPEGAQAPQSAVEPTAYLERMARVENERDSLNKQLAELAPKASKADEVEAALAKDPIKFLLDRGVTHEALQEFLLHGPKKVDPAVAEAERLAKQALDEARSLKQAEEDRQVAANVARFKQTEVAAHLSADEFPLLHGVHGDNTVEQVYAVMNAAYQRGESLSAKQAAAKLEGTFSGVFERMLKVRKQPETSAAPVPAAPKQKPRVDLTNGSLGAEVGEAPPGHYDPAQDEARKARALELMRRRLAG